MKKGFKNMLDESMPEMPESFSQKIDDTLGSLEAVSINQKVKVSAVRYVCLGLAAAACIMFLVLALPALIKTPEEAPEIAQVSPVSEQAQTLAVIDEPKLPDAYSQKLCSFAVQMGDYVYYSNPEDGEKLYKIKEDGTEKTKLSDKRTEYVQVVGDWVYFVNDFVDDHAGIYKVSVNGGEEICLYTSDNPRSDGRTIYYMVVNNNKIYFYEPAGDLPNEGDYIYKIDLDGKNKTKIAKAWVSDFYAVDGYIYYYEMDDAKTYRMRDDGTEKIKFVDEEFVYFTISDGWMYYSGHKFYDKTTGEVADSTKYKGDAELAEYTNQEYAFYRIRLDGTDKSKLKDSKGSGDFNYFVIDKDWIYYGDGEKIYKMKTDGSEHQLLFDKYVWIEGFIGEWMYVIWDPHSQTGGQLYKVKTDGTDKQEVKLFNTQPEEQIIKEEQVTEETPAEKANNNPDVYDATVKSLEELFTDAPNSDGYVAERISNQLYLRFINDPEGLITALSKQDKESKNTCVLFIAELPYTLQYDKKGKQQFEKVLSGLSPKPNDPAFSETLNNLRIAYQYYSSKEQKPPELIWNY